MSAVDCLFDDPITIIFDSNVSHQLEEIASQQDEGAARSVWQRLLSRPDTPDDVLGSFLEAGLLIDELGHRNGPEWLLDRLAQQYDYPEAILTLLKDAYESPHKPGHRFQLLLDRFGSKHEWIFESLAHWIPSSEQKRSAFLAAAGNRSTSLGQMSNIAQSEMVAKRTQDENEIRRLFAMREPRILRAIAQNPSSPEDLLRELADLRSGPLSRVIRARALNTLQKRRNGHN